MGIRKSFVISTLLLAAFLWLMPVSPVSTFSGGMMLATSQTSGGHMWNFTRQHTWQSTSWQHSWQSSWQRSWNQRSSTFTGTATFTRSSTTITRTFTHTPRTFSHTFQGPVIVTETQVVPYFPCYPDIPGCPGYPYFYATNPPPPLGYCYTGTPGYPFNCPPANLYYTSTVANYATSAVTGGIPLTPAGGSTAHDMWLVITPLPDGQFAVFLSAQGLQQNGIYLIEGVTRSTPTATLSIGDTTTDSEFTANSNGDGLYWHVLESNPQVTYVQLLLFYLPNMQMQNSQLVANAYLG